MTIQELIHKLKDPNVEVCQKFELLDDILQQWHGFDEISQKQVFQAILEGDMAGLFWDRAGKAGNKAAIRSLLLDGRVDPNVLLKGDHVLLWPGRHGHIEVVKLLLADMRVDLSQSKKAFYAACEKGHTEVVKLLLADERVDLSQLKEAFDDACMKDQHEVVALLLAHKRVDGTQLKDGLWVACANGSTEVVKLLLADKRFDPNVLVGAEYPLLWALLYGHKDVMALLLADGRADPNQPNSKGHTPLFMAVYEGDVEMVALLLADPRITHPGKQLGKKNGGQEYSNFYWACRNGSWDIATDLLFLEDATSIEELWGETAEHFLRKSWQQEQVENAVRTLAAVMVAYLKNGLSHKLEEAFGSQCSPFPAIHEFLDGNQNAVIPEIETLLQKARYPEQLNDYLRKTYPEIGDRWKNCQRKAAAGYFAAIVFLSDGLLEQDPQDPSKAARFLRMVKVLPLELQMILCHRIVGNAEINIPGRDSEPAFRKLVEILKAEERWGEKRVVKKVEEKIEQKAEEKAGPCSQLTKVLSCTATRLGIVGAVAALLYANM